MSMHVGKPLQRLIYYVSYGHLGQRGLPSLHHLVDVLFHVFKHKIQSIVVFDDLVKVDDVRMVESG